MGAPTRSPDVLYMLAVLGPCQDPECHGGGAFNAHTEGNRQGESFVVLAPDGDDSGVTYWFGIDATVERLGS